MRSLTLVFGAALLVLGCSSNPGGPGNGNGGGGGSGGGVGGNGGNGGSGGGGGSGGSGGPTADMAVGPDMAVHIDRDPTAHPTPIDITNAGPAGTIMAPQVYVVVWVDPANAGDDQQKGMDLVNFYSWMVTSDYFTKWGSEYGVMKGSAASLLIVPEAPPATIKENSSLIGQNNSEFVAVLNKYIGQPNWPAANAITGDTIFAFFLDPKTVAQQTNPLTMQTAKSCSEFGGYHITGPVGNNNVPYIVVARCPDIPNGPTEWQQDTIAASHELAETVADPQADGTNSGDRNTIAGGGEVGDICLEENLVLMNGSTPYTVQRLWSEVAWKAGNVNPCVPADGPWFGAGIKGNDTSANAPSWNVVVHVDKTGKGSADFEIWPFSYDKTITNMRFELVKSLMPAGITLTPDIARSSTSGMWGMGAPGTTFKVHVDASGAKTGKAGILGFAVVGTGATQRVSNWWGRIQIVSP
jgi:hypothetical protein